MSNLHNVINKEPAKAEEVAAEVIERELPKAKRKKKDAMAERDVAEGDVGVVHAEL